MLQITGSIYQEAYGGYICIGWSLYVVVDLLLSLDFDLSLDLGLLPTGRGARGHAVVSFGVGARRGGRI